MKTVAIIPARFGSSRFPGKPLATLGDRSVIRWAFERVSRARLVDTVVVATDDERIARHIHDLGGEVVMTSPDHTTGTERCAEVARHFPDCEYIVNVQGDIPLIEPAQIDQVIHVLGKEKDASVVTLVCPITLKEEIFNPNTVKTVFTQRRRALYFSRSTIPYLRDYPREEWMERHTFYKHLGVYGFHRDRLFELAALKPTPNEQLESLEQLRWLEAGHPIHIEISPVDIIEIDTPEDLARAAAYL